MVQIWMTGTHAMNAGRSRRMAGSARQTIFRPSSERADRRLLITARILFFLSAFLLLFCGLTLMRSFASPEAVAPETASEMVIYADTGDTLWSLASAYKKPSMDTRQAIYYIVTRNQLGNSDRTLRSGQMLILPAEMLP